MKNKRRKLVEAISSKEISDEIIATRAYEKWEKRGRPVGDAEQDWFAARTDLERELREEREASRNDFKEPK